MREKDRNRDWYEEGRRDVRHDRGNKPPHTGGLESPIKSPSEARDIRDYKEGRKDERKGRK